MTKIPFENSEILQQAKVTIDGVDYPVTPAQIKAVQHYLSAEELNALQDNIESDLNTKANIKKTPQTTEGEAKITYMQLSYNDGWKLYIKAITSGAEHEFTTDLTMLS